MVSDIAQAMEVNNIFDQSETRKLLKIREALEDEIIPPVLVESKPTLEIDPDFFVVGVAHGMPKDNKFAYIKRSVFPVENREKFPTVSQAIAIPQLSYP